MDWGWVSDLWVGLRSNPAFWTLVGFAVSGGIQYGTAVRLADRNFEQSRIKARDDRLAAKADRIDEFERESILGFARAIIEVRYSLIDLDSKTRTNSQDEATVSFILEHEEVFDSLRKDLRAKTLLLRDAKAREEADELQDLSVKMWADMANSVFGGVEKYPKPSQAIWDQHNALIERLGEACRKQLYGDASVPDTPNA